MPVNERITSLVDEGSFVELDSELRSINMLEFPGYSKGLREAVKATGRNDAVVRGHAVVGGLSVAMAAFDFGFIGGSIGCVAGEKIARTFELGTECGWPVLIVTASGGARVQEGLFALMQVAKMIATRGRFRNCGKPFVCVLTDPSMAGALISFAASADLVVAEPEARISFAGQRVRRDTEEEHLASVRPSGVHAIVPRRHLRGLIRSCLRDESQGSWAQELRKHEIPV